MRPRLLLLPALTLAVGAVALSAGSARAGRSSMTRDEALAAAYPGATFRAEQVFLTAGQQRRAETICGAKVPSALVARYIATEDGRLVGRAYVDTHVVRTKRESLLVSLDAGGRVKRVDVTAFLEPSEYQASDAWLKQYRTRLLDDELRLDRAIRPIAGATLTANAATEAVRRVLALDLVLREGTGG
ncbi:MAG TPA: FMN-binding protein [Vicinamibacterales bacterium]|nr:FMN-binding protein [Vicinamibacterales bacterium]